MTSINLYNHTARLLASGTSLPTHVYRVKLLSAGAFTATATTLEQAGGTELANGNGYTSPGPQLNNVTVTTPGADLNDARFDADDVVIAATNDGLTARFAILFNDTLENDPPLAFINFDADITVAAGASLSLVWNASGIFLFTVSGGTPPPEVDPLA